MDRRSFITAAAGIGLTGCGSRTDAVQTGERDSFGTSAAVQSSVYFEDVGIRGGSGADPAANSRAFAAALRPGVRLEGRPGERYPIASTIHMPDHSALTGTGGDRAPVLYMPAAFFDNGGPDALIANRYGRNAVGIDCSGSDTNTALPSQGIRLAGIAVESERRPGRVLRGILGRNVEDLTIEGVAVSGLPIGVGICLASARGATRIADVMVRDFFDDSTGWESLPQGTGIEIDNDLVGGLASTNVVVRGATIRDIAIGERFRAKYGPQTDGLNVAAGAAKGLHLSDLRIARVEEGIDLFGMDMTVEDIELTDCGTFGLKLVHGAHGNVVRRGKITGSGLAGIVLTGSRNGDVRNNRFEALTVSDIDPHGRWSENSTACVRIDAPVGGGGVRDNLFVDCTLDPGRRGQFGWLDMSSRGADNRGDRLVIRKGSSSQRRLLTPHGGSAITLAGSSVVHRTSME